MITLTTVDHKKIAADVYTVSETKEWVIYVHMMPSTRGSWRSLATCLQEKGIAGLAIDLRGHGESDGGPEGYHSFDDKEHQASINDIDAAVAYCKLQGVRERNIILIGASIGANLVLQYITEHSELRIAILLSAGLNYRGVAVMPIIQKLNTDQRICLVSSEDDTVQSEMEKNADENRAIFAAIPEGIEKKLVIYEQGGHGTHMFETKEQPRLVEVVEQFVQGY
ncbi:MAG: alpha/beta fold hydrolase [bacterium]